MDPTLLLTRGKMLEGLSNVSADNKRQKRSSLRKKGKKAGSPASSTASSRSSSKSRGRQRRPTEQQITAASRVLELFGDRPPPRQRKKSKPRASEVQRAENEAAAMTAKKNALSTLKSVASVRQRLAAGSATDRQLTAVVNASTRVVRGCTERILQQATEAQETGVNMLVALETQLVKLDNIEDTLGTINGEMQEAEAEMENLEKCCGLCVLPWNREPNIEDTDEYVDTWEESLADTITAAPSGSTGCKVAPLSEPSDLVLPRLTEDDREKTLCGNMERAAELAAVLCSIAKDINYELNEQNEQCDRILAKAETLEERIRLGTERSLKILEGDDE